MITDRKRLPIGDLLAAITRAVEAGVDLVQIREKDLSGRALEELVGSAVGIARSGHTRILVNGRLDVALAAGADGLHLPVSGLPLRGVRRLAGEGFLVGVSTHRLDEARAAAEEGADFLVFGPVFETRSKPDYGPPVGLAALAEVVREVKLPVFALGGVEPERVPALAAMGVAGVAGISVFVSKDSMARLLAALRVDER